MTPDEIAKARQLAYHLSWSNIERDREASATLERLCDEVIALRERLSIRAEDYLRVSKRLEKYEEAFPEYEP